MCDHLVENARRILRLSGGNVEALSQFLSCCRVLTLTEEFFWASGFTLIALGWITIILLLILTCTEGRTEKLRARRHSRLANEDDGFFVSIAKDLNGGLPMTDRAVKGLYEVKNLYENLPNMYAEAVAVRIAVQEASEVRDSSTTDGVDNLWRYMVLDDEHRDSRGCLTSPHYMQITQIEDEESFSPWGHLGTLRKRLMRLSEKEKRTGCDNKAFEEIVYDQVGSRRPSSTYSITSACSDVTYSNVNSRNSRIRTSLRRSFKRRKKSSQISIKSNLSQSSISLNDKMIDAYTNNRGILHTLTCEDQEKRYKRKRRHGVSFLEEKQLTVRQQEELEFPTVGTV